MTAPDDVVEKESNERPGNVVDGRGGWDQVSTAKDDWEVHVFEDRVWPLQGDQVGDQGSDGTNKEEEEQATGCKMFVSSVI